ncbi:hypothetical protein D9758_005737 [Tetrapyrgos nigripes]|uniref:Uncharacterized protein n=1 Tax=Tetrapyrgos nigripes TaxID=182062 RepID=A0A8H5GJQ4_9AGAR|nr:hypothetical protein D9758_005737 [Tetrapyrgos nigripes]
MKHQRSPNTSPSLLDEYNISFKRLQRRSRIIPVIGEEVYTPSNSADGAIAETLVSTASTLAADLPSDSEELVEDTVEDFTPRLADILDGEDGPLATLENEEDIALDMDVVEVEVNTSLENDSDGSDEE